jgi:hypothetical protein
VSARCASRPKARRATGLPAALVSWSEDRSTADGPRGADRSPAIRDARARTRRRRRSTDRRRRNLRATRIGCWGVGCAYPGRYSLAVS